jgi:hypothetical protein
MKVTNLQPRATVDLSEDRRNSRAFSDLEPEVVNLSRMARLAEIQLDKAIGQLACKDGNYIEAPEYEAADLAIFAVSEMAKMTKRFDDLYYSVFEPKP